MRRPFSMGLFACHLHAKPFPLAKGVLCLFNILFSLSQEENSPLDEKGPHPGKKPPKGANPPGKKQRGSAPGGPRTRRGPRPGRTEPPPHEGRAGGPAPSERPSSSRLPPRRTGKDGVSEFSREVRECQRPSPRPQLCPKQGAPRDSKTQPTQQEVLSRSPLGF